MLFQMRYKKDLEEAEERAVTHFRKLIEIKRKIENYEKEKGNPYSLIREIKNLLYIGLQ